MRKFTLLSKTWDSCTKDHELFHPAEGKLKPDLQPWAPAHQHIASTFYLKHPSLLQKTDLHCMCSKAVVESTATGSDNIRRFWCSRFRAGWWVLMPLGARSGYACDFRYGSSVYLPTCVGCLLLWCHLSRWALLTACDTPPDGLSWPKHFAEPTAHSKGEGGLGDSCNYTPRGVNHPREKHRAASELLLPSNTTTVFDFKWSCRNTLCCFCMFFWIFFFFFRLTCCNKAAVFKDFHCSIGSGTESTAAAPDD